MEFVLRGGSIVDPSQKLHGRFDLLVKNGRVADIAPNIDITGRIVEDVEGLLVVPGLIDLHTHLREPGGEAKETIETGSRAAAAGGYTTITALPNTQPVTDDAQKVEYLQRRINDTGLVRVLPVGAATKGSAGEELADIGAMVKNGIVAVTDDGRGVQNSGMLRKVLLACKQYGIIFLEHCEDESLAGNGQVHDGAIAGKLGLPGISAASETVMIARDVLLAGETGARVHIMHVSSAASVDLIRLAKSYGLPVTAEVTPHHLLLTEEAVEGYHASAKMKPPLRTEADREGLRAALADGTLDIVATDHAPHTNEEKSRDFTAAPFGIVGLETAFPLLYTYLVKPGIIDIDTLIERMSCRPAAVFNLPYGTLKPGSPADIAVFNLRQKNVIDSTHFYSKGRNTPFAGWNASGIPVLNIVDGKIIMRNGRVFK